MKDGPRKSRKALVLLFALTGLFTLLLFWGEYDVFSLWDLRRQRVELARKVEQLKVENQSLRDQIESLKDNPGMIEKIARENLGMSARGETVYRIVPAQGDTVPDSLKIRE